MTTETKTRGQRIYLEHRRGYYPSVGLYDGDIHREHWNCTTERRARNRAREIAARYPDAVIQKMSR